MRILNTRPHERAAQLSNELIALGYQVQELPLLELCALPLDKGLIEQFQAFLSAEIVVVVSPIAVQIGMQYYQQLDFAHDLLVAKQWIAVGQTTQQTLLQYGIESVCPSVETSEGMLQLPILQHCQNQNIAFWRGLGGRTFMMQQLQQQGCYILNMLLYTRQCPDISITEIEFQLNDFPIAVLISSEESWKNWLKLCANHPQMQHNLVQYVYLVLGERVGQVVLDYFQQRLKSVELITLSSLSAQAIHQQLRQYQAYE